MPAIAEQKLEGCSVLPRLVVQLAAKEGVEGMKEKVSLRVFSKKRAMQRWKYRASNTDAEVVCLTVKGREDKQLLLRRDTMHARVPLSHAG